jgi:hypothetical protein
LPVDELGPGLPAVAERWGLPCAAEPLSAVPLPVVVAEGLVEGGEEEEACKLRATPFAAPLPHARVLHPVCGGNDELKLAGAFPLPPAMHMPAATLDPGTR